jgi:hypothetical protein
VRLVVRTALGLFVLAGGLTFFCYGLAQAIENGSCGTDKYGRSVGPPCPSGTGAMIALMVLGVFAAFGGASLFASRRPVGAMAMLGGTVLLIISLFAAGIAAAVIGIVDLHDDDTRPGYEIVVVVLAAVLLPAIPALLRRPSVAPTPLGATPLAFASATPQAPPPATSTPDPAPPFAPATPSSPASSFGATARAEDIASRLRQLEQLKESGLLSGDEYDQRRKQILAEL